MKNQTNPISEIAFFIILIGCSIFEIDVIRTNISVLIKSNKGNIAT